MDQKVYIILILFIIILCGCKEQVQQENERYFKLRDNLKLPDGGNVVDIENETQVKWADEILQIYIREKVEDAKQNPDKYRNTSY